MRKTKRRGEKSRGLHLSRVLAAYGADGDLVARLRAERDRIDTVIQQAEDRRQQARAFLTGQRGTLSYLPRGPTNGQAGPPSTAVGVRLSAMRQSITAAVTSAGRPVDASYIVEAVGTTRDTATVYLGQLARAGLIERVNFGLYAAARTTEALTTR